MPEIWLIHCLKHTGKQSDSYDEAVEEAASSGSIDRQVRTIELELYTQRYSSRTKISLRSESTIIRAEKMSHRAHEPLCPHTPREGRDTEPHCPVKQKFQNPSRA